MYSGEVSTCSKGIPHGCPFESQLLCFLPSSLLMARERHTAWETGSDISNTWVPAPQVGDTCCVGDTVLDSSIWGPNQQLEHLCVSAFQPMSQNSFKHESTGAATVA